MKAPKICTICKMVNNHESNLCSQCGKPLNLETALEAEQKLHAEQEKSRIELEEIKKRVEELEYGAEARKSTYAKNMLKFRQEKNRKGEVFTMLFNYWFEAKATEEEKRQTLKRIKQLAERGEKFDISWFGESAGLKLENLKNINNIA